MKKHYNKHQYQGKNKTNYFEGWYYKQVTADGRYSISFIPGVSKNEKDTAFIQCIISDNNNELKSYNIDYEINEFISNDDPFNVKIANSIFSLEGIQVNLLSDELMINGEIAFGELSKIRQSILTPNIMGFFSYIPNMECNHGILSMGHKLFGKLIINGEEVDFTNGEGYIEKDYGTSFPESYIWIQSNHFSSDSRLLFSTATIPFMGFSFQGLICNLQVNEKEYRFATYNVSRLKIIKLEENLVSLSITKGRYKLLIDAKINDGKDLKAPYKGKMNKIIKEVLGGQVKFDLYHNSKLIISDESNICGIEIVQDLHKN